MSKSLKKYIIILLGLCITWLYLLPFLLTKTIHCVCKKINEQGKYEILLDNFQINFTILPKIHIIAKSVSVKSKDNQLNFKADNFKSAIRLLPLLSGKLHINYLDAGSISSLMLVSKDFKMSEQLLSSLDNFKFDIDSANIKEYKFRFDIKSSAKPVVFEGKDFIYQQKNKYFKLKSISRLLIDGKKSEIKFNIYLPKNSDINNAVFEVNVSRIELALFKSYLQLSLLKNLRDLKGYIDIHANKGELITELNNCAIIMRDNNASMIFPNKMSLVSKFKIRKKYIKFDDVTIQSDNVHINIKGFISDYLGKTEPKFNLTVCVSKSRTEDIIKMLPVFKIEEIDSYKLKKYKFYGDILGNLTIKGQGLTPDIVGNVYISNGVLTNPLPNVPGATIKLGFTGKHINYDIIVPTNGNEKVFVKGVGEIYNEKIADMRVTSTPYVNLQITEMVLNPLHEILNFLLGPLPIMYVDGTGNIDIVIKGNRKYPHIWGKFNAHNATVYFLDFKDIVMKNAEAVLTFKNEDFKFETLRGHVNNKDFVVNGTGNFAGKFDFNVTSNNQPSALLAKAVLNSDFISALKIKLPKINVTKGTSDINFKIYGNVKYIEDFEFNKNVFADGIVKLNKNRLVINDADISELNGVIKLKKDNVFTELNGYMSDAKYLIKGFIKGKTADLNINIPKFNPNLLLKNKSKMSYFPVISIVGNYKGSVENIDYKKLVINAKIIENLPDADIIFNSGNINVKNGNIEISDLKGYITNVQNKFAVNLQINNFINKKPKTDGNVTIKTSNVSSLNEIYSMQILPKEVKKYFKDYELNEGKLDLNLKIKNSEISTDTNISGIKFVYLPLEMPVSIINGRFIVKNNDITLKTINMLLDNMPVLADGNIQDIFGKQKFNLYINSKPRQEFIDKYINKKQIYPLKIRGDIVYSTVLKGVKNDFDLNTVVNLSKNSYIYYQGATISDIENAIMLDLKTRILNQNICKLKEFSYSKLIAAQSGKQTPLNLLSAYGEIDVLPHEIYLKGFHIKTFVPTDARIFNIIFRKPNIKSGQFTSNLILNGNLSELSATGNFHLFETDIPFWDISMKNINLIFNNSAIDVSLNGDVMGNDFNLKGVMKNKLKPPYTFEKAEIYTKNLDLNRVVNKLKTTSVEEIDNKTTSALSDNSSLILNNLKLKADNITLRNIKAQNVEAFASINPDNRIDIKDFRFNIANGLLSGKYNFDVKNRDMKISLLANDISANDISIALFNLDNQIYGKLTGQIDLTCNGETYDECMKTLDGETEFNVKDGRMPKLGSLEYLLKAGNLLKGGVTSLSINSIIDVISPLKTGEFSDINGNIKIENGFAKNIEIITSGKDLSLLIFGTYNLSSSNADMTVLGLVSRKISTMFGKVGNVSLNTLFNLIPGVNLTSDSELLNKINKIPCIEFSEKYYRKFVADIKGNIKGDNYVTNFSWVN